MRNKSELTLEISRLHELFYIDQADGLLRRKITTSSRAKAGAIAGSPSGNGYLRVIADGKKIGVHRIVFAMTRGFWPEQVDHIDGNRSNNLASNLRAATPGENGRNAKTPRTNTSGVKGVSRVKCSDRWQAYCDFNGKRNPLGVYKSISDAEAAVRAFRKEHHGEFARHA